MATKKVLRIKPPLTSRSSRIRKALGMAVAGIVAGFGLAGFSGAVSAIGAGVGARIALAITSLSVNVAVSRSFGPGGGAAFSWGFWTGAALNRVMPSRAAPRPMTYQARVGAAAGRAGTSFGTTAPGTNYVSRTVQAFGNQAARLTIFQETLQQYAVWPGVPVDLAKDLGMALPWLLP